MGDEGDAGALFGDEGEAGALFGAAKGGGGEMKDGSWQHCNIRSVKPRLDTESVCPSKILVRTPQSALPSGQTLSTPQDEMSACSGMPGPGKVEPSLQRKSTFKPPAGSLFATDGGLLHFDQEGGIMRGATQIKRGFIKTRGAEDNYERNSAPADGTSRATRRGRHSSGQGLRLWDFQLSNRLILLTRLLPSRG